MGRQIRFFLAVVVSIFLMAVEVAPAQVTLDASQLPSSPGYHLFKGTAVLKGQPRSIACGIFLPPAYFANSKDAPLPMVVTLHNRGINGNDGRDDLIFEGLAMLVAKEEPDNRGSGDKPDGALNLHHDAGFIVLIPQCPDGYGFESPEVATMMDDLIGQIVAHYKADTDRLYLTGFSYGGSCTWQMALQLPHRFAAIAPLDARATAQPAKDVKTLDNVAIYLAVGGDDHTFLIEAARMNQSLMAEGRSNFTFRTVPHGNHWCYSSVYTDPDFWKWMFRQHRKGSPDRIINWPGDTTATSLADNPIASSAAPAGGGVLCQYWRDLPGKTLADLTADAAFPKFPTEQIFYDRLEIPPNQQEHFASVLKGLIHPPVTGDYAFYIASDAQGQLLLSGDSSVEKAVEIATVPKWSLPRNFSADPHQTSKPVHLLAGQSYYIEARQKDGGGDNHLCVAWKLPDGKTESPIPASRLTAANLAEVPSPEIALAENSTLPTAAGASTIKVNVNYLGHRQQVDVSLVLPKAFDGKTPLPALVYLRSGDATKGPDQTLVTDGTLSAWSHFVVIGPQQPTGDYWKTIAGQRVTTAIIDKMLHDLPIDKQRIYLTGSLDGATALWRIAPLLAAKPAAIVPFCTMQAKDPDLAAKLDGTEVHIITGVLNGLVTDCAHRMCDALSTDHPAPDIVFEMKMGSEVAGEYYGKIDFYQWLLKWHREAGKPAVMDR